MDYKEIIDGYNDLRERCLELAKKNVELIGSDAWLRSAIQEGDVTLDYSESGIHCHGYAYTTQTMSNEYFSFVIPYDIIEEK